MRIKEVTLNDLNEIILSEMKLFKEELRINHEHQLIGYIIAEPKKKNVMLHRIAINSDHQHQGFGSLLLIHVETLDLPITVYVNGYSHTAINFFEANKFNQICSDSKGLKYEKQPSRNK